MSTPGASSACRGPTRLRAQLAEDDVTSACNADCRRSEKRLSRSDGGSDFLCPPFAIGNNDGWEGRSRHCQPRRWPRISIEPTVRPLPPSVRDHFRTRDTTHGAFAQIENCTALLSIKIHHQPAAVGNVAKQQTEPDGNRCRQQCAVVQERQRRKHAHHGHRRRNHQEEN